MQFFYDGQVKRYLTQFMRVLSNFSYQDAKGKLTRVPVRYGDMTRQVAQILNKNSENTIPTAPLIACYIKDIQFDKTRIQDPTFVSSVSIRERQYDPETGQYMNVQGANYTVDRIMPSPHMITFHADIWTTNTDQKLQLWEQIAVLFNPSLELQTTDNYIDWTSLSVLTLESQTFSSRSIPQGIDQDIDILTMIFTAPIWISPPAKVKQLGVVTSIINNVFSLERGEINLNYSDPMAIDTFGIPDAKIVVTPGNFELLVLDNVGTLLANTITSSSSATSHPNNSASWRQILDAYPGQFRASLSQIRLLKADGGEIVAYVSLDPLDEHRMALSFDPDTVPASTTIDGRNTIDAIINPDTFIPTNPAVDTRYLILEDINVNSQFGTPEYSGPPAWKNLDGTDFQAYANDIIRWDGSTWSVIFNSLDTTTLTYITNTYTGVQYKWDQGSWSKSYEGVYSPGSWRLIL